MRGIISISLNERTDKSSTLFCAYLKGKSHRKMFLMFAGRFSYSIFTSYCSHTIHRMMECSSIEKNVDDEKKMHEIQRYRLWFHFRSWEIRHSLNFFRSFIFRVLCFFVLSLNSTVGLLFQFTHNREKILKFIWNKLIIIKVFQQLKSISVSFSRCLDSSPSLYLFCVLPMKYFKCSTGAIGRRFVFVRRCNENEMLHIIFEAVCFE